MKKDNNKPVYRLELTERHAKLLSYACDQFSRLICGQDIAFQDLMEAAWEKRCKEAVGGHGMDKEWDGGWYNMRHDAEEICQNMKKRFGDWEDNLFMVSITMKPLTSCSTFTVSSVISFGLISPMRTNLL